MDGVRRNWSVGLAGGKGEGRNEENRERRTELEDMHHKVGVAVTL